MKWKLFLYFDYETTRHETRHTHARDAFNVPKSTDGATLLLDAASSEMGCVRILGMSSFFFFCYSGLDGLSVKILCSCWIFSHTYNDTQQIRIAAREKRIAQSTASVRAKRVWMLIAKHVDFSMRLLSTFHKCRIPRSECSDKNGVRIQQQHHHHLRYSCCLFLSPE